MNRFFKKVSLWIHNRKHGTMIHSLNASLRASYGEKVRVDANSAIAADVSIGDYSYVNTNSSLENCDVGKFCSISSGVNISPYEHNRSGITTHPTGDCKRERKRCVIGNDVLVSLNVTIMEGVHIGDGAVIAAGAVVTHDVGDYEVVGGVPAHFIHYRVEDEAIRRKLKELQWWNMEPSERQCLIERYRCSLDGLCAESARKG